MDIWAQDWRFCVASLISEDDHRGAVKTIRFRLPVLALGETSDLLDLVTSVSGVAAALVDVDEARLDVIVESDACGLLVREELRAALDTAAAA